MTEALFPLESPERPGFTEPLPPLPDLTAGAVELPALTQDEFAVLGDDPVLRDADIERTWSDLPEAARSAVRDAVLRGLVARRLAEPSVGGLVLHDALRTVLGVRSAPAFVVVGDEPTAEARRPFRGYGVALDDDRADAVLLEWATAGVHRHLLASPADAARRIAMWALAVPVEADAVGRTLEVLLPGQAGPLARRLALSVGGESALMAPAAEDGTVGQASPADMTSVGRWLSDAWSEVPAAVRSPSGEPG